MIIIFDLDDTLYEEFTYVRSSFKAVAYYLSHKYALPRKIIYQNIISSFNETGRGHIFDDILKKYNIFSASEVNKCVSVYRKNKPNIKLFSEAKDALIMLSEYPKYVLSDGNKLVQSTKVNALSINRYFRKILLTHRYGIKHSKPSTYCFMKIKEYEKCNWDQMVYIGDDPNKDFVNINPLGIKTIRVLTGRYGSEKAKKGYDARIKINNLSELAHVLGI